ncbi:alpha/beta hydrolase [Frateuria aurantia]
MTMPHHETLPPFPETATALDLPGPCGPLQVVAQQAASTGRVAATAVICHPHPLQGGTMQNKVVTMLERSLRERGLDTVRFNFRGVGSSAGSYDGGNGEGDDLAAVAGWVRAVQPDHALWLAGFSFGSYVSIRNARRLAADALISVAPPVGRWPFDSIELPGCPWWVLQGEQDEVVDPAAVYAWIEQLPSPPTLVRLPDTGHFFHGKLLDLRRELQAAALPWPPPIDLGSTAANPSTP